MSDAAESQTLNAEASAAEEACGHCGSAMDAGGDSARGYCSTCARGLDAYERMRERERERRMRLAAPVGRSSLPPGDRE
jgi:hypothetical protein